MASIKMKNHIGKWHKIDENLITSVMKNIGVYSVVKEGIFVLKENDKLSLWEHDTYGDMSAFIVAVERNNNIKVLDDDWYDTLELWITENTEYVR